jgi:hypothetical protein
MRLKRDRLAALPPADAFAVRLMQPRNRSKVKEG